MCQVQGWTRRGLDCRSGWSRPSLGTPSDGLVGKLRDWTLGWLLRQSGFNRSSWCWLGFTISSMCRPDWLLRVRWSLGLGRGSAVAQQVQTLSYFRPWTAGWKILMLLMMLIEMNSFLNIWKKNQNFLCFCLLLEQKINNSRKMSVFCF